GATLGTASDDGTVRLWNVMTHKEKAKFLVCRSGVMGVAMDSQGRTLAASTAQGEVVMLDLPAGREARPWAAHTVRMELVTFSGTGNLLATAGADGTTGLWDAATGKLRFRLLETQPGPVRCVAFAPGDRVVATAGQEARVTLWNPDDGKLL